LPVILITDNKINYLR